MGLLLQTLLFLSCSPTKPIGKTISGKVILENTSDFSNVKVSLFNLPQIDTSILNVLSKYPSLLPGVDLNIYLFDQRKQKPFAQTLTDKEGIFSFSNIPDGEYIIFAQKEGYGWRYFKISTSGGEIQIQLNKEVNISGIIQGQNKWTRDRNYIIEGDVEIPNGSSLYIENGCVVRFNGNFKIRVNGRLENEDIPGQMPIIFTTDDTTKTWGGIYVSEQGQLDLKYSVFRSASVGIFIDASNANVSNSIFIDNKNYGVSTVQISNAKNIKIEKCIFTGQPIGLNLEFTDTTVYVKNSIFVSNYESGIYATTSSARIENNYFSGNRYSIQILSNINRDTLLIKNNEFRSSKGYHIVHKGGIVKTIYNEILSSNGGIVLSPAYGTPINIINFNNIAGKKFLLALGSGTKLTDAKFNYWGTESEAEIRNLIFDRNDVSPSDQYYYSYGIVDYSNYFSVPVKEAGVK
ncbi:right-handed parallel beta-helix repeat-containing protein [Candidatus Chrysopegis kryptomonas]|uniref:right-handed parallel beta-helix repeat-containing protein n=1 Tax=Candidatus Chryseopegocella kryptomonas TaxID=1633643 RepID=UPI00117C8457|nr:right-handed parallel beta-helix repeat-containing protein [Candidatus Chrysopegis kryptomonas]